MVAKCFKRILVKGFDNFLFKGMVLAAICVLISVNLSTSGALRRQNMSGMRNECTVLIMRKNCIL